MAPGATLMAATARGDAAPAAAESQKRRRLALHAGSSPGRDAAGSKRKMPDTAAQIVDPNALRAEGVSRHYQMGGALVRAVDGISLAIRRGEFVALLGSSGSGKSTLLNLMAGLDRPTSGAILAHEKNLGEMTSEELARHRSHTVGMVFQAFNLLPRMTLAENIELPLRLAEVARAERPGRVNEAIRRVRLEKRATHRPAELSGGEQQRAALARALVNRPTILLADEPTGNLDSATGDEIMALLREINESGVTIVMVTHEQPRADKYAHRTIVLKDGKIAASGDRP